MVPVAAGWVAVLTLFPTGNSKPQQQALGDRLRRWIAVFAPVTLYGALAACSPEEAYFKRLHAAIDPLIGQNIQVAIAKIGPPWGHDGATYAWRFNKGVALPADAVVQARALDVCTLVLTTNGSGAIINAAIDPLPSCEPVLQRLRQ